MSTATASFPSIQRPLLFAAITVAAGLFIHLAGIGFKLPALFAVGRGMGVALYHAAFGFTGAYRRLFTEKAISGVPAQLIMLAAAMLLFAPILAQGQVFGQGVVGAAAPVSTSRILSGRTIPPHRARHRPRSPPSECCRAPNSGFRC